MSDLSPPPSDWRNPRWDDEDRVHNWRNHVSEEVQAIWDSFTDWQKMLLAQQFEEIADREHWD